MVRLKVNANKLNKRSFIPAKLPEPNGIVGVVFKDYEINAEEVANAQIPNPALGKWYKGIDNSYYWAGGVDVTALPPAPPAPAPQPAVTDTGKILLPPPATQPHDMPLTKDQCITCAKWLDTNFGSKIHDAVTGSPFDKEIIYGIACQETAYRWRLWINKPTITADQVLAACVFDASGDFPGTDRSAFPANRKEFLTKFSKADLDMLVAEGNKMRHMPQPGAPNGYSDANFLYKGYGIFQYDLQFIENDRDFFLQRQWYSIDECIKRVLKELNEKWGHTKDYFKTVKSYNGSGERAQNYATNVSQFYTWIKNAPIV